jgi:hypothetical protein
MDDTSVTSWVHVVPWWYRQVPKELAKQQQLLLSTVVDYFSFGILLKTLFQPWKRDVISTEGISLQKQFEVFEMNTISRLIGAVVRAGAMFAGGLILIALLTLFALLWVSWLVAPVLAVALIAYGMFSMVQGVTQ